MAKKPNPFHHLDNGEKIKKAQAKLKDGDKNYHVPCEVCGQRPTVHPLALCGPCCFGEASTLNGNW